VNSQRLAPLGGILFVVALVVGLFVLSSGSPEANDSAQTITSYYTHHHQKAEVSVGVIAVGLVFLVIFFASLHGRLKAAESSGNLWSTVVAIGAAAGIGAFLVAGSTHIALADGGTHGRAPDVMVALNTLDNDSLLAFVFGFGIVLLGVAGATLTTGGLPKWLGWAALVLGVLCFTPLWFAGIGLGLIWIIVASIVMSRAGGTSQAATA
jgi:hypothetical protein